MEFKDIISIGGMPGLYELLSTKADGIIVRSLEDGKSQFVSSRIHGVSALDTISVYLQQEETTELKKVLRTMLEKESTLAVPDGKADNKSFQKYFREVLPLYDEEKVHVSDMKKMVKWYQLLKKHQLIPEEETRAEEPPAEKTTPAAEPGS